MSLKNKTKLKGIRKKMFGKGAKIVFAYSDDDSKKEFDDLIKLRKQFRAAGGEFKKK